MSDLSIFEGRAKHIRCLGVDSFKGLPGGNNIVTIPLEHGGAIGGVLVQFYVASSSLLP